MSSLTGTELKVARCPKVWGFLWVRHTWSFCGNKIHWYTSGLGSDAIQEVDIKGKYECTTCHMRILGKSQGDILDLKVEINKKLGYCKYQIGPIAEW